MKSIGQLLIWLALIIFSFDASAVKRIAVEGNSGAGKTTLINILATEFNANIVEEPFDKWLNVNGKGNLFGNFLSNGQEWSIFLCIYSTVTKINALLNAEKTNNKDVIFIDRTILSDSYAFGHLHQINGWLSLAQQTLHNNFINNVLSHYPKQPHESLFSSFASERAANDLKNEILKEAEILYAKGAEYPLDGIIYLRTSPAICKDRADERDREFQRSRFRP